MSMGIGSLNTPMPTADGASRYPIQELNALKHMSPDQIKAIAMDPNNPIRTFAIAKLNSMKIDSTLRNTAGANGQPTVAQKVLQEANTQPGVAPLAPPQQPQGAPQGIQVAQGQPQQAPTQMAGGGLAELDTGDMYNEHNYAGGGIVAFGDGGDVATDAYWAQAAQSDLDTPYLTPSYLYAQAEDLAHRYVFPNRIVGVDAHGKPITERQKYGDDPYTRAWKTSKLAERDKWLNKKASDQALLSGIPQDPALHAAVQQIPGQAWANSPTPNPAANGTGGGPGIDLGSLTGVNTDPSAALLSGSNLNLRGSNVNPAAGAEKDPYADAIKLLGTDKPALGMPPTSKLTIPDKLTPQQAADQTNELERLYGVDPAYFSKRSKDTKEAGEKELAEAKKFGEAGIYLAAAKGVLRTPNKGGIAGGLAEEINPALSQYNKDIKEINRHNKDTADKLADAEYANKLGKVDKAQKAIQDADKSREQAQAKQFEVEHADYRAIHSDATSTANNVNTNRVAIALAKINNDPSKQPFINQFLESARNPNSPYWVADSQGNKTLDTKKMFDDGAALLRSEHKSPFEVYNDLVKAYAIDPNKLPYSKWLAQQPASIGGGANAGFTVKPLG